MKKTANIFERSIIFSFSLVLLMFFLCSVNATSQTVPEIPLTEKCLKILKPHSKKL